MQHEQIPEFLFKYTTFDTVMKTINNSSLYWSSVSQFNDPFEYKFRFFTNGNANAVTARFLAANFIKDNNAIEVFKNNKMLQDLRDKYLKEEITFNSIEASINNLLLEEKLSNTELKNPSAMSVYKKIFLETIPIRIKNIIDDTTGVLCLTDDSDERSSRLMWSHYADCHKGVRIKLKTKFIENISDSMKSGVRKVFYQEDFPLIEYDDYLGFSAGHFPKQTRNLVNKMIFTKSDEWSYENEYRSVIPFNNTSRIISVNPDAFDSIFLGLRTCSENQTAIIDAIHEKMPHVKLFQTIQDDNSYRLTYTKI